MPIVVNGVTIPTQKGSIVVNGVQVEKVIANNVEVWKAGGEPFDIVAPGNYFGTSKIATTWRVTAGSNSSAAIGYSVTYKVGDILQLASGNSDYYKNASVTWQMDPIDTKGCTKVRIFAGIDNRGYITINNGERRFFDGEDPDFDYTETISESTLTIKAEITSWSEGNQALLWFRALQLS